jgi:hypothetical protein
LRALKLVFAFVDSAREAEMSDKRQKTTPLVRLKTLARLLAFATLAAAICLLFLGSTLRAAPEPVLLGGPTYVSGVIDTDTNWTVADSPYLVTGDLTVSEGVTLTIEPGVEVRFATTDALSSGQDPDRVELIVAGTLVADEVTFTSNADSPAAGDWYGIWFLNSSVGWDGSGGSAISNSTIEYGIVGISIDGTSPMISNNTITEMRGQPASSGPECNDTVVDGRDGYGIYVTNEASPMIVGNIISGIQGGWPSSCRYHWYSGFVGDGGSAAGIHVSGGSSPTIARNMIHEVQGIDGVHGWVDWICRGGAAPGNGGKGVSIYVGDSSCSNITNNIVSRTQGGNGGNGDVGYIEHCYIDGASGGLAAGIYVEDSSAAPMNNTIVASTGGQGGVPGVGVFTQRVGASIDDAREFDNGDYDDSGSAVLLGDYNGFQDYVGFRFSSVYIQQGAIIDSAMLTLTAYETSSETSVEEGTQFLIKGEAIGHSPTFSADNSPRDRTPTAAGVIWTVTEAWVQGQTYSSPDLTTVIQEIVNREDWWSITSALTILVLDVAVDNQNCRACTWDKDPSEAAQLTITWHKGRPGRDGIGVGVNVASSVDIVNNIVVSHTIGISGTTTTATLSHNDVWGNSEANYSGVAPGTNDISADPLFVDPGNDDYHLQCGSPAIDAGTNEGAPPADFENDPRPLDGNSDGIAVVDMGADEFKPIPIPVGGIIVPVSKLELLAPWIYLGLLALVAGILLVRRHIPEQG